MSYVLNIQGVGYTHTAILLTISHSAEQCRPTCTAALEGPFVSAALCRASVCSSSTRPCSCTSKLCQCHSSEWCCSSCRPSSAASLELSYTTRCTRCCKNTTRSLVRATVHTNRNTWLNTRTQMLYIFSTCYCKTSLRNGRNIHDIPSIILLVFMSPS